MATAPKAIGEAVPVNIIVDNTGAIKVEPDPFWVSKGKNEEVVWHCTSTDPNDPHPDFEVVFGTERGSPFHETRFNKERQRSGLVKPDAKVSGPKDPYLYKYTVTVGKNSLDPGGGVNP